MAKPASKCLFLLLLLIVCNSVKSSAIPNTKDFEKGEIERENEQIFHDTHRGLLNNFHFRKTEFDSIDPTTTTLPITNPVTTPAVTFPPDNNPAPVIVTVPATNPVNVSPNPVTVPDTNPVNPPVPITNPVTTPSTFPGAQPTANPVMTFPPPSGGETVTSPVIGNAPASPGQSWCIAKNGAPETALQSALDYACGIGRADCSMIQQGASCYNPNTLQNHASYAFNNYYQKNPVQTSCEFGGAAVITNVNPSTGSCVYPSSSSPSSAPVTINPTPTPATASSTGSAPPGLVSPPPVLNPGTSYPGITAGGGFGVASPPIPIVNSSTPSKSNGLQPSIACLFLLTTGILIFSLQWY